MKRIRILAMLILSFVLLIPFYLTSSPADDKLVITHGPYLMEPGEDCITIVWFTNKNCQSWVEYCGDSNFGTFPSWGGYPEIVKNSTLGLVDANTRRHVIRLNGLEAGKRYRYRIVSKEILQFDPYEVIYGDSVVGEICEFETLDTNKKTFSFAAITDVHERSAKLDTLLRLNPVDSADLVFFTGDILNWIGDEERIYNGFLDVSVEHFAKNIPFVYTRGNHETRGPNARKLFSWFPHSSGRYNYAFSHGNVRFIVLDSGEDKPDSHPVYAGLVDFDSYRSEQAEWLKKEVESEDFNKALYKIVLFHIPPFTGSEGHGAVDVTKKWGPILNNAGIDLTISGHTHRYARIQPEKGKNNFPVLILGRDMIMQTQVTVKDLSFVIKNMKGEVTDSFVINP